MKARENIYDEKIEALMKSMHNPRNIQEKLVKKYGVPYGKIISSKELSAEDKIKLINRLIKKTELDEKRIESLLKMDDKMDDIINKTEQCSLPIGLACSLISNLSAYAIFAAGIEGHIDFHKSEEIGEILLASGLVTLIGGFVSTSVAGVSGAITGGNKMEHTNQKETLLQIQKALKTARKRFIRQAERLKQEEIELV